MLSWVGKVVPQPPEKKEPEKPPPPPPVQLKPPSPPPVQEAPKTKAKSPKVAKKTKQPEESTSSSASGKRVLTWISESFTPPQPVKANGNEENGMSRSPSMTSVNKEHGVLGGIVVLMDALETVVPLPQPVAKEEPEEPEETEVYELEEMPDAEPLPHIPAIEVESDHEEEEEDDPTKPFPPRVIKKIKRTLENLVPQPEIYINANGKAQKKKKAEAKPPAEAENGSKTKVVGWIVQEFERILPQPAAKNGADEVQKRG